MKIGILGTGKIARKMADTINLMDGFSTYAIASRTKEKLEEFTSSYKVEKAYVGYEALLDDKDVELVYIATPHNSHKELISLCIDHKKPVLCEKAFCINKKEAEEVLSRAKKEGVFVAEAIWTRYMPSLDLIRKMVFKIGKVSSISANLSYRIFDVERLRNPGLGGGALLDIGVYPINFALMVHPVPVSGHSSTCTISESGVDMRNSISLKFSDGVIATLFSDITCVSSRKGYIYGDKGYVEVENINCPEKIRLFSNDRNPVLLETYEVSFKTGYEFELLACRDAIRKGKIEPDEMPHSEILRVMSLMDEMRASWGVKLSDEL